MNLIQTLEAEQIKKFTEAKKIPEFRPGDTLKVGVKVVEGERTRVQNFEGVCIARANKGMGSNFTVRKISFGEGVERVFPLYSPTSIRSKWCAGAWCAAPSSIISAAAAASRRASPSAATSGTRKPPPNNLPSGEACAGRGSHEAFAPRFVIRIDFGPRRPRPRLVRTDTIPRPTRGEFIMRRILPAGLALAMLLGGCATHRIVVEHPNPYGEPQPPPRQRSVGARRRSAPSSHATTA